MCSPRQDSQCSCCWACSFFLAFLTPAFYPRTQSSMFSSWRFLEVLLESPRIADCLRSQINPRRWAILSSSPGDWQFQTKEVEFTIKENPTWSTLWETRVCFTVKFILPGEQLVNTFLKAKSQRLTWLTCSGPIVLMVYSVIIFLAVSVSKEVSIQMPALLIRRFSPHSPTCFCTCCTAASMLLRSVTSGGTLYSSREQTSKTDPLKTDQSVSLGEAHHQKTWSLSCLSRQGICNSTTLAIG